MNFVDSLLGYGRRVQESVSLCTYWRNEHAAKSRIWAFLAAACTKLCYGCTWSSCGASQGCRGSLRLFYMAAHADTEYSHRATVTCGNLLEVVQIGLHLFVILLGLYVLLAVKLIRIA